MSLVISRLVDGPYQCMQRGLSFPDSTLLDSGHECLIPHVGDLQTWALVRSGILSTHKCSRNASNNSPGVVFLLQIQGCTVQVLIHNTAAMFFLNRQGVPGQIAFAQEAGRYCIKNAVVLNASHFQSVQNHVADHLNRTISRNRKWSKMEIVKLVESPRKICSLCD